MSGGSFVRDLLAAMPTPQARMLLTACLAKYAGQTIYIPSESKAARRTRAARHMLSNGDMNDAEIAATISTRFQVSTRQAQRDVSRARQMSYQCVAFEGSNAGSGASNEGSNNSIERTAK